MLSSRSRVIDDGTKQCCLNASTYHPAAKKECFDAPTFAQVPDHCQSYETVIDISVDNSQRIKAPIRTKAQIVNVLFRIAPGRQVKLVGLLCQLRNACEGEVVNVFYDHLLLQRAEEVFPALCVFL